MVSKIQIPELNNNRADMMFISRWPKALSDEKVPRKGSEGDPRAGLLPLGDNAYISNSGSPSQARKSHIDNKHQCNPAWQCE